MGVVLDFLRGCENNNNSWEKRNEILDNSTWWKIINIVENNKWYNLSISDIIWALISHTEVQKTLKVEQLEQLEYKILYSKLIDVICTIWNQSYNKYWYSFKYNEETKLIYFIINCDKVTEDSFVLDVLLTPNKDFSFTWIKVFSDWNLIFNLWENYNGYFTWYNPIEELDSMFLDDEAFLTDIWEKEKHHIENISIVKNDLIWAIVSNFSHTLYTDWENIEKLESYSKYQLLYLLTEIIFNNLWEKFNFVINHSELYLDMKVKNWDDFYLVALTYKFNYDEKSNNTSIHILDWEKIVCIID